MLVLSRKRDESIVIDHGQIRITIVEIRGDKVRVGIDAPPEIDIHRQEVESAIQAAIERGEEPRGKRRSM